MSDFKEDLLSVLVEIKGNGSFVSAGVEPFRFPGLVVRGVGEISFPGNEAQIRELIKFAHVAPFGKGSETVVDTSVRNVWEIDAQQIQFKNKDWEKFLTKLIAKIKPDLGIEEHNVEAHLYKLLIYEEGHFFVTHKDSEKEKGMFGTLVIGLPCSHTGGELVVQFDGREEIVDFSAPASEYKIPFAAFYADCDHEIKPITSGNRICLVYNLVQHKGKEKIELSPLSGYAQKIATLLESVREEQQQPLIVLLGHQYTPANYSMESLKLDDRPRAEALIMAAEKAGYNYKMALVTSYLMGELETDGGEYYGRRGRRYYDDDDDDEDLTESGTMGEIHDENIDIEHWMEGGMPPLERLKFDKDDLVSPVELNEGEPTEKEAEGYTGNAGMEMTYWYH